MCTQTISISEDFQFLNYLNNCVGDKLYPPLRLDEDENFIWIDGADSKKASISKTSFEVEVNGQLYTDLDNARRAMLQDVSKVNLSPDTAQIVKQLDDIIEIIGQEEIPFEINTGVDELVYQNKGDEYLVFLFRTNPLFENALIERYDVSCLSSNNDNYIIKIGFGKVYDHTFTDANFVDVDDDSKLQVAVPGLNSVPAIVLSTGFNALENGRNINSKFGKGKESILFDGKNPIKMPKDIFIMGVTITPMSNGANIATSLNWSEEDK